MISKKAFYPLSRWFNKNLVFIRIFLLLVLITIAITLGLEHYYPHLISGALLYILLEGKAKRSQDIVLVHNRPADKVLEELAAITSPKVEIKILDNFILDLLNAKFRGKDFFSIIQQLVSHKVCLKVLLLDPNSFAAKQRILVDLPSEAVSFSELNTGLSRLHSFWFSLTEEERKYLDIKIFNATPSIVCVKLDKRAYISFFDPNAKSQENENLLINYETKLGSYVDNQFAKIWTDKETVSLERYMMLSLITEGSQSELVSYHRKPILYFCGADDFAYLPKYIAYKPDQNEKLDAFLRVSDRRFLTLDILNNKASFFIRREIKRQATNDEYENILSQFNKKYKPYTQTGNNLLVYPLRIFEIEITTEFFPITCLKKNIPNIIQQKKFAFIPSNYFDINVKLFWDAQGIANIYSHLIEDTALKNDSKRVNASYGERLRKIAKFEYDYDTGLLSFLSDGTFSQRREYKEKKSGNTYVRQEPRSFEIAHEMENNYFLKKLIKFDLDNLVSEAELTGSKWLIHIHFIKILATKKVAGHPSPEGIHNDNHDYMAWHFIEKKNIVAGGETQIHRSMDGNSLLETCTLENFMDTIYINDRDVYHYTTPFKTDSDEGGYRSILLVDYDKK